MLTATVRPFLRRILPIVLFALGCFPSRGLYFLLHASSTDGRYHGHQPVLSSPTSRTPRLKAAKVPLPARLTRVPRTVRKIPVPAPAKVFSTMIAPPASGPSRPILSDIGAFAAQPFPASPPSGRAPPAAAV